MRLTESQLKERIKESIYNLLNDENFLQEYRKGAFNNARKVSINELNAKNLLDRHSKYGFIVISPCRGYSDFGINKNDKGAKEKLAQINNLRVKELISIIKQSGYSYTPVYGEFVENKGTDNEEIVYERSFIIYAHDKHGNVLDVNELVEFGKALASKYNQDSFLVKVPNEPPKYITSGGDVDMEFSGNVSFNDVSQQYFTDLHKNTHKFNDIGERKPTRFSYVECYINPAPQCLSESHVRYCNNEIFLPYKSM